MGGCNIGGWSMGTITKTQEKIEWEITDKKEGLMLDVENLPTNKDIVGVFEIEEAFDHTKGAFWDKR